MLAFSGRKHELTLLNQLLEKKTASMAVIYGRRRVGKSRLIEEFSKSLTTYTFTGLHPDLELSKKEQIEEFATQVGLEFKADQPTYKNWSEAFHDLAERTKSGKVLIVLDEITWMGGQDPSFLGKLKIAWDKYFKKNPELILILCGSVSAWINKNILASTGFHGRISLTQRLKELPIPICKNFWGTLSRKISSYEKLKILAVTGGIPKYLEEINLAESAEQNIKRLGFLESGILYNDFKQIFSDSLQKDNELHRKIVKLLANGIMTQSKLTELAGTTSGGRMSDCLEDLTLAGFITKHYVWKLSTGTATNSYCYRLSDNYLRFYLKYILPNAEKIISGHFQFSSFDNLPAWSSIIALQIENLVLNNRQEIIKRLNIPNEEIVCDGPYLQRKTKARPGCQIDYLIQTKFGGLYLCEIKFTRNTIRKDIIKEIEQKINALSIPKNTSVRPILIHVGDLHDELVDLQYFAKTINLTTLLD